MVVHLDHKVTGYETLRKQFIFLSSGMLVLIGKSLGVGQLLLTKPWKPLNFSKPSACVCRGGNATITLLQYHMFSTKRFMNDKSYTL